MAAVRTGGAIVTVTAISIAAVVVSLFICNKAGRLRKTQKLKKAGNGLVGAIGNTPLIRINSLSDATVCEVLLLLLPKKKLFLSAIFFFMIHGVFFFCS